MAEYRGMPPAPCMAPGSTVVSAGSTVVWLPAEYRGIRGQYQDRPEGRQFREGAKSTKSQNPQKS